MTPAYGYTYNLRMSQKRTQAVSQSRARVIEAGGTHISGVLKPEPAEALERLRADGRFGTSKNSVISAALLRLIAEISAADQ